VKAEWKKTQARYVRVTAKNAPAKSADASAPPAGTWLFADELIVQ
jgi:hypothetical protein